MSFKRGTSLGNVLLRRGTFLKCFLRGIFIKLHDLNVAHWHGHHGSHADSLSCTNAGDTNIVAPVVARASDLLRLAVGVVRHECALERHGTGLRLIFLQMLVSPFHGTVTFHTKDAC